MRISFESFTRHCRGTVTSITFTFSLFLLLSLTNFPYQALTMMSPEEWLSQSGAGLGWAPKHGWAAKCSFETPVPTPSREAMPSHPFWTLLPQLFFGQIPASTEPANTKNGCRQGLCWAPPLWAGPQPCARVHFSPSVHKKKSSL